MVFVVLAPQQSRMERGGLGGLGAPGGHAEALALSTSAGDPLRWKRCWRRVRGGVFSVVS